MTNIIDKIDEALENYSFETTRTLSNNGKVEVIKPNVVEIKRDGKTLILSAEDIKNISYVFYVDKDNTSKFSTGIAEKTRAGNVRITTDNLSMVLSKKDIENTEELIWTPAPKEGII